jgi:hypothetical protein
MVLPVALACAAATAVGAVGVGRADPSNSGTLTYHFFNCTGPAGTPGSFDAVRQSGGDSFLLTSGTGVFAARSYYDNTTGQQELTPGLPGLSQTGLAPVTCNEIGPESGNLFTVIGVFFPT